MYNDINRNSYNPPVPEEPQPWFSKNMFRLMVSLSITWCAIILIYITKFFGWDNLFLMMPNEFAVFLAGITLPLPIIWLALSFIDREQNFKQEAKFLRSYIHQLVYPDSSSSETSGALSDAIRLQVLELQETVKLATQKTEGLKNELGAKLNEFANILQVLDNYSSKSIGELTNGIKTLTANFDNVRAKAYQATKDFNQCGADFSKIGDYLQTKVTDMSKQLAPSVEDIKNSVTALQELSDKSFPQMVQSTKQAADYFAQTLNASAQKLEDSNSSAQQKVEVLTQNLQKLSQQIEQAAGLSSQYFEKSGDKLRAVIIEMTSNAERILNNIHNSGTVFLQQSADLTSATDNTLNHVSSAILEISSALNNFNAQGADIVANSKNFNAALQQQIDILAHQAQKANQEFLSLEEKYRKAKVDTFLRDATTIITKLDNLSVDINAVMGDESQEKLWKRYYEGDTGIFLRTLNKNITKHQALQIKEEYEQNPDFRELINNYMKEFENLVAQARACEKSNILLSLISGGDIGKIYYVLAHALEKLN